MDWHCQQTGMAEELALVPVKHLLGAATHSPPEKQLCDIISYPTYPSFASSQEWLGRKISTSFSTLPEA